MPPRSFRLTVFFRIRLGLADKQSARQKICKTVFVRPFFSFATRKSLQTPNLPKPLSRAKLRGRAVSCLQKRTAVGKIADGCLYVSDKFYIKSNFSLLSFYVHNARTDNLQPPQPGTIRSPTRDRAQKEHRLPNSGTRRTPRG